ncbi:hypothetical protein HDU93_003982 [Gonapodya sp. JEL0774]|nr:hypothetical protein HDU93_003982 [Gonapodya sp. JEL0774]
MSRPASHARSPHPNQAHRSIDPVPLVPANDFRLFASELYLLDDTAPIPVYPPYKQRWVSNQENQTGQMEMELEEGDFDSARGNGNGNGNRNRKGNFTSQDLPEPPPSPSHLLFDPSHRSYYSDSDDDDEDSDSNDTNVPLSLKPYFRPRPWLKQQLRRATALVTPFANRPHAEDVMAEMNVIETGRESRGQQSSRAITGTGTGSEGPRRREGGSVRQHKHGGEGGDGGRSEERGSAKHTNTPPQFYSHLLVLESLLFTLVDSVLSHYILYHVLPKSHRELTGIGNDGNEEEGEQGYVGAFRDSGSRRSDWTCLYDSWVLQMGSALIVRSMLSERYTVTKGVKEVTQPRCRSGSTAFLFIYMVDVLTHYCHTGKGNELIPRRIFVLLGGGGAAKPSSCVPSILHPSTTLHIPNQPHSGSPPVALTMCFPHAAKTLVELLDSLGHVMAFRRRRSSPFDIRLSDDELARQIVAERAEEIDRVTKEVVEEWKHMEAKRLLALVEGCWTAVGEFIAFHGLPSHQAATPSSFSSPIPIPAPTPFLRDTPPHLRLSHLPLLYNLADLCTAIFITPYTVPRPEWYGASIFPPASERRMPTVSPSPSNSPSPCVFVAKLGAVPTSWELQDAVNRFVWVGAEGAAWFGAGRRNEQKMTERRRERRVEWRIRRAERAERTGRVGDDVDAGGGDGDRDGEESEEVGDDIEDAKEHVRETLKTEWFDMLLDFQTQVAISTLLHAHTSARNGTGGSRTFIPTSSSFVESVVRETFAKPDVEEYEGLKGLVERTVMRNYKYEREQRVKLFLTHLLPPGVVPAGPSSTSVPAVPLIPLISLQALFPYASFRKTLADYLRMVWLELGGRPMTKEEAENGPASWGRGVLMKCVHESLTNSGNCPWFLPGANHHSSTIEVKAKTKRSGSAPVSASESVATHRPLKGSNDGERRAGGSGGAISNRGVSGGSPVANSSPGNQPGPVQVAPKGNHGRVDGAPARVEARSTGAARKRLLEASESDGEEKRRKAVAGRSYFHPDGTPAVTVDAFAARKNSDGRLESNDATHHTSTHGLFQEETGILTSTSLRPQVFTVDGDPSRDPRGHGVTIAYAVLVEKSQMERIAGSDDAKTARWVDLLGLFAKFCKCSIKQPEYHFFTPNSDLVVKGFVGSSTDENPTEIRFSGSRIEDDQVATGFDHLSMIKFFAKWLESSNKNLAWVVNGREDDLLIDDEE